MGPFASKVVYIDTSMSYKQFKQLLRAKINLESVGFEPLTKLEPIFYTKIMIFKSNFQQDAMKGPLRARNWFEIDEELPQKWMGGMKLGPKVYRKQVSSKS